jgi:hypothetical protein
MESSRLVVWDESATEPERHRTYAFYMPTLRVHGFQPQFEIQDGDGTFYRYHTTPAAEIAFEGVSDEPRQSAMLSLTYIVFNT